MVSEKELLIMSMLRMNARASLTEISRKTHIPVSTLYNNIKRQEQKTIKKHTSLLNFRELGYGTHVAVLVRSVPGQHELLRAFLLKSTDVNSAFRITNSYDFFAECVFKTIKELQQFLQDLGGLVAECNVLHILDELKREHFLSNPNVFRTL